MRVAEQAGFPTAEAVVRDGHGDRHVDADHADLHVKLVLAGRAAVSSEDRRTITVLVAVDQLERLGVTADASHAQHRPEDLVVVDLHAGFGVIDQADAQKVAVTGWHIVATVHDQRRTRERRTLQVPRHPVPRLAGDEWPHLVGGVSARTDLDLRQSRFHSFNERLGARADGDDHADRHATLARTAKGGADRSVSRHFNVGVRQQDHVVFRAAQRLHALAVLRAGFVNVLGNRCATDEADRLNVWMLEQTVYSDFIAL